MSDLTSPTEPAAGGRDDLSALCMHILSSDSSAYAQLVVKSPPPADATRLLTGVKPSQLLARPVKNIEYADAMLAGLWLWRDALHESHAISQRLSSDTGSFWHAIMHRREGDFSNARYWYARCRHHPALKEIHQAALAQPEFKPAMLALERVLRDGWDGSAFVDLVEDVYGDPRDPSLSAVVRLQRLEWRGLFNFCVRHA